MQMAIFTTESDGAKAGGYARMSFQTREALGMLISNSNVYIEQVYYNHESECVYSSISSMKTQ